MQGVGLVEIREKLIPKIPIDGDDDDTGIELNKSM